MRVLSSALCLILMGAAPAAVPIGKFQTWAAHKRGSIDFTSGGVWVHVEALPCPSHPTGDSPCRWDGYDNQAAVTVTAPGLAPLSTTTDRQSSYARIAVVRFRRSDPRPGVIIESQSGGSGGDMTAQLLIPSETGYRAVSIGGQGEPRLQGQLADSPQDLSGDGSVDLRLEDGAFDSVFGCNACTPRPPKLFTVRRGMVVDESRDPALRRVFAADMARLAPICLSTTHDRNGACAAYIADAARAGRFQAAWAAMLKHYEHGGSLWEPCSVPVSAWADGRCPAGNITLFKNFPASLAAFLKRTGYFPA